MPVYSYRGKLIRTPTGGIAGNENCCCDHLDVCECLTGPIPEPLVAFGTIPPVASNINWPCFQDIDLFWFTGDGDSDGIEMCMVDPCKMRGIQFEDAYRITDPPYTDLIDSCAVSGLPEPTSCCQQVDMWYPNPNWGPPPLENCGPPVDICSNGVPAPVGDSIRVELEFDCGNLIPDRVVSVARWTLVDACVGASQTWIGYADLGPPPVDPTEGLGTYVLSPGELPLPLPAIPYANLRLMAQHTFDVTDGIYITFAQLPI